MSYWLNLQLFNQSIAKHNENKTQVEFIWGVRIYFQLHIAAFLLLGLKIEIAQVSMILHNA